jgi:hypothetical protein
MSIIMISETSYEVKHNFPDKSAPVQLQAPDIHHGKDRYTIPRNAPAKTP